MDDRMLCVVGTSFVPNNSAVIFSGPDLASPVCRCLIDREMPLGHEREWEEVMRLRSARGSVF